MNRHGTVKFLVAAAMGAAPPGLFANGVGLVSQDGFASARGEAFVATADNPSAIHYNPAGITQLEGNNFRAGVYGLYFDPAFTPPSSAPNSGNTYHVKNNFAAVAQLFCAHTPVDFPLSFGLGVYSPYGAGVGSPGTELEFAL